MWGKGIAIKPRLFVFLDDKLLLPRARQVLAWFAAEAVAKGDLPVSHIASQNDQYFHHGKRDAGEQAREGRPQELHLLSSADGVGA